MNKHNMEAPVTIDIEVHISKGHGEYGKVTVGLPTGKYPTKEDIDKAIEQAKEAAEANGYHVCDCDEFMKAIVYEKTGQYIAIAGNPKWNKPYSPRDSEEPTTPGCADTGE